MPAPQPLRSITRCIVPGCREFVYLESKCSTHYQPFRGHNRKGNGRMPKNWEAIKESVLTRDRRICYLCGGPGANSVDHVVPAFLQPDGKDDHSMENLKAAHMKVPPFCHDRKSAREGNEAKKVAARRRGYGTQGQKSRKNIPGYPF